MSAAKKQDAPASSRPKSARRPKLVAVAVPDGEGILSPDERCGLLTAENSGLRKRLDALREENGKLLAVKREHELAFEAFTQPTDGKAAAAGLLGFVSDELRAFAWSHSPNDEGGADAVLIGMPGHDMVRRFRFLSSLVDLATSWTTGAAK